MIQEHKHILQYFEPNYKHIHYRLTSQREEFHPLTRN